jgi:hypothetical protein
MSPRPARPIRRPRLATSGSSSADEAAGRFQRPEDCCRNPHEGREQRAADRADGAHARRGERAEVGVFVGSASCRVDHAVGSCVVQRHGLREHVRSSLRRSSAALRRRSCGASKTSGQLRHGSGHRRTGTLATAEPCPHHHERQRRRHCDGLLHRPVHMGFVRSEMAFSPGLYANRSRRASKLRWVDGNLVRFRDGVPAQVGGWAAIAPRTGAVTGLARSILCYRPNSQAERLAGDRHRPGRVPLRRRHRREHHAVAVHAGHRLLDPSTGYGTGLYGTSTYGTPRPAAHEQPDRRLELVVRYVRASPARALQLRRQALQVRPRRRRCALHRRAGAPTGRAICMSDERHCFMFGCDGNPGLVRWSDREDYTVWTPLATNRAGGYELQVRSPFQCGVRVRGQVLGLTKTEVFAFTPLQNALVYARDRISTEGGVIGPHAIAVVTDSQGETAYWMGSTDFFAYDGLVRTLDCELRDYVFNDINLLQARSSRPASTRSSTKCGSSTARRVERSRPRRHLQLRRRDLEQGDHRAAVLGGPRRLPNPIAIDAAATLYSTKPARRPNGAVMPSFVSRTPSPSASASASPTSTNGGRICRTAATRRR